MAKRNNHKWTIQWLTSIDAVARDQWDRMAFPLQTPLLEWQWLYQLEASGSISREKGWYPCHLAIWDQQQLVAAAPLYIKIHSEGEFVFDHWWSQLAGQYGIVYYPKLVGMSPVTPAVGYRFLVADGVDQMVATGMMFKAIDELCRKMGLSGCHLNFVDPQWLETVQASGFMAWQHQSFLWHNPGYITFEDYLQPFKSSQRRNIRRELRQMQKLGIDIHALTNDQITPDLAPLMYKYYLNTNAQYGPWAAKFLNADFFERIFRHHRHRLLLMAAYQRSSPQTPVALSMLLFKNHHLIGRYWGSSRWFKDLHFNMCFYAPIQWAIARGIKTFDPGAGSPHKIYRGFRAVANTSLHRFFDPRLEALFQRFIHGINQVEETNIENLNTQLPLAKAG